MNPDELLSDIVDFEMPNENSADRRIIYSAANICDINYSFASFDQRNINENTGLVAEEDLDLICTFVINYDNIKDDQFDEESKNLIENSLNNVSTSDDGRVILPLLWNKQTCNYLPENFSLSKRILDATLRNIRILVILS